MTGGRGVADRGAKVSALLLTALGLGTGSPAAAESSARLLTRPQANQLMLTLSPGTTVREFCGECDWLTYEDWAVATVESRPRGDRFEIRVNGRPAELEQWFVRAANGTDWVSADSLLAPNGLPAKTLPVTLPSSRSLDAFAGVWSTDEAPPGRMPRTFALAVRGGLLTGHGIGATEDDNPVIQAESLTGTDPDLVVDFVVYPPSWRTRARVHDGRVEFETRVRTTSADPGPAATTVVRTRYRRIAIERSASSTVDGVGVVDVRYPQFEAASAFSPLNQEIETAAIAALAEMQEDLGGIERPADAPDMPAFQESRTVEVTFYSPDAISVTTRFRGYTGGAHGLNALSVRSYRLEAGKPREVDLRDALVPGAEARSRLLALALRAASGEGREDMAARIHRLAADDATEFWRSFSFLTGGDVEILVAAGPEVVPWDFVRLSNRELGPLLAPTGPLSFLLHQPPEP